MKSKKIVKLTFVLFTVFLISCATTVSNVGKDTDTPVPTSYENAPWTKLWSAAFADDFNGKAIKFDAMWIGVSSSFTQMHMSAGFAPYNSGKWVEIGVTELGDEKTSFGQYSKQQWGLYIPKSKSGVAFELTEGDTVTIYAVCKKLNFGSALTGSNAGISPLVLEVQEIEKK